MGHLKSGTMHTKNKTNKQNNPTKNNNRCTLRWRETDNDPLDDRVLMEIQKRDVVVSASLEV